MQHRIEHFIVAAVVKALTEEGDPVTGMVDLSEGHRSKIAPGTSALDITAEALDMEITRLVTKSGKWFTVIDGNEEYVISDWHIDLSGIIEPVTEPFQD